VRALHGYLCRTPSRYVLAALGDAVGDLRQPNLPGTVDEYPNWRLPVADSAGHQLLLEDLCRDPRVERLATDLAAGVR
jgi:4-alpha-glucanotransferase